MAVLDAGAATAEQLQALKQHPTLQQAFTVYVSRPAALKASLAGALPEAVEQQLATITASQEAVAAVDGLVQVCGQRCLVCKRSTCQPIASNSPASQPGVAARHVMPR